MGTNRVLSNLRIELKNKDSFKQMFQKRPRTDINLNLYDQYSMKPEVNLNELHECR
jgi:hypothetical protein